MDAGRGSAGGAARFPLKGLYEFPDRPKVTDGASGGMLSPTDISVVLVGTIVATGLALSMPLVFMAVLPGCVTPDPRCFDYPREVTLAASKQEDVDPCDDFYRCEADTYLMFHKRSVKADFRHDIV
ncbi:uncharacterized protein LOC125941101 [Dermacentor silvarum]|uniref:uncharacterized protein LOC125941101 n=1 Tax=Dermacentor silvarum TaxID=543639 RepID=UPI0021007AD9|nr:uncharacterized protein LOC125941101 [Dermacentor silvarum]